MVELAHNLRYNRPQLGQYKDGGVEDARVASNICWTVVLREFICDTVEGFDDVAELRWRTLYPGSVPIGSVKRKIIHFRIGFCTDPFPSREG